MENLVIFAAVTVCLLAIFVLAYKVVTDKIIKDQEREIKALKKENKRLKTHIDYLNKEARSGYNIAPVDPTIKGITFTVINPEGKNVLDRLFEQW